MRDFYNRKRYEHAKKMLNFIVYASSGLDVLIAVFTGFTFLNLGDPKAALLPIEYALTATVVITVIMAGMMIYLKHEAAILSNFVTIHQHFKKGTYVIGRIKLPKKRPYSYSYKP